MDIFPFLDVVLKEESAEEAIQSAYRVDETPDDLTKWLEDNMLGVYDADEAARAYDFLANADIWLGRVRASQNYSYWRYATDNAAGGVAAARNGTKGGWTRYGRPQFWPGSNKTADEVCRRIADRGGMSMAIARRAVLPFLSAMTHHCKPRELTVAMAAAYDFDESHVAFVTGSGESTKKVASIVEDAETARDDAIEAHAGDAFARREGDDTATGSDESTASEPESNGTANESAASVDDVTEEAEPDDGDDQDQAGLSDFV
jgi:replication factor C large subunit